jgi:zinc protease
MLTDTLGKPRRRIPALLAIVLFSPLVLQAQTLPDGVVQGPSLAGVTEYTYPNGLRVLLLPDPGSSTITVNITYLVGSRHEGYGESGMVHLLEHLLFIESVNGRNIKEELEDHGARWNGTTWYDRTNYFETVNASEENLVWALGLETERMRNMRTDREVLDTEMTVVRNEFELGENDITSVLDERVFSTAFLWHNYGRSTIGAQSDIESVTSESLTAFYRKYYRPDNAILIIAGRIDPAQTLALIADSVGAVPRPDGTVAPTYTVEPPQDGERRVELRRVGSGQNLMVAFHIPALAHPDSATFEVMADILTGGGTGRLDRALEDTQKALSVGTTVYQLHDPGLVLFSATLNDEQSLEDVESTLLETLAALRDEPPTAEEVERARSRILQRMDRLFANSQQLAMELTESAASGDWRLLFTDYEAVRRVTPEDVESVAQRYFLESNRTVGVYHSTDVDRTVVPEAPEMETLLTLFTPDIEIEAGEALDPDPHAIEARVARASIGGLRLAMLPKETRGGRVQASITLRYGNETDLVGRNAAASMAGSLLSRGTETKSRQALQDAMTALNATINVSGGLTSATASISTTGENLIAALGLAKEMLSEPSFPETDFQQIRDQRIAQLERNRTEPDSLVGEVLQRNLSPYPKDDVRYVRTMEEEIADFRDVTLDDVRRFHRNFYGASQGEVVVVGRFEPAAVASELDSLFSDWRSPAPYRRIVNDYLDVDTIDVEIRTPDKENAEFSAGLRLRMDDSDPDYPAMIMADYMFGGGLTARLPNRVRNLEGLSYSVGSNFSAPAEGDAAIFSASAIANPANIPRVEASFMDELRQTLRDGFTSEELVSARRSLLDERIGSRSSDGGILNLIAARERWGRTLAWDADLEAALEALTVDEVNAAFRRHIDPDAISIVEGGDFGGEEN